MASRIEDVEQALHTHAVQVQSYRAMLAEAESALANLAGDAYRVVGNLMVKADPVALRKELEEKRHSLTTRLAALERQEEKLREELQKLQDAALGGDDGV